GRVRRDERPEPPGRAAPDLVEAADRLRLDDGDKGGLRGRLRARAQRPGAAGHRLGVPARGGAERPRAARGGRAVREDRAPDPGIAQPPYLVGTSAGGPPSPRLRLDASGARVTRGRRDATECVTRCAYSPRERPARPLSRSRG